MNLDIEYLNSLMADVSTEIDSKKCIGAERSVAPEGVAEKKNIASEASVAVERPSGLSESLRQAPPGRVVLSNSIYNVLGTVEYHKTIRLDTGIEGEKQENTNPLFPKFTLEKELLIKSKAYHLPSKLPRVIDRYITDEQLKTINDDLDVARDMLAITASHFMRRGRDGKLKDGYITPEDGIKMFGYTRGGIPRYYKCIDVLIQGTKKAGPIIIQTGVYVPKIKCNTYRYAIDYAKCRRIEYKMCSEWGTNYAKQVVDEEIALAEANPEIAELVKNYKYITLPTESEIIAAARHLHKTKATNKDGAQYIYLGKHARAPYLDDNGDVKPGIRILEDDIALFKRNTEHGYIIPKTSDKSAGRIYDSFNAIPSWIRKLIKFGDSASVEVDYSTLHPNLAVAIYGVDHGQITHDDVAEYTGLSRSVVKTHHLSYFNMEVSHMRSSKLNGYYTEVLPELVDAIEADKKEHGHKITSLRMFDLESRLMYAVMGELRARGIGYAYIFDAIAVSVEHAEAARDVMNIKALELNVKTVAK